MYKVINGHRYDTDTARELARDASSPSDSLRAWQEILFKTKTGLYFVCGHGGPLSRYGNESRIIPIREEQARQWVEAHCDDEVYDRIFGAPKGGTGPKKLTVMLSAKDAERLEAIKAATGRTYTELLSGWIWAQRF